MTCVEFEDRLFDEDCRAALLGRAAVPADVAEHLALCSACERQWAEAVAATQRLAERLVVTPSPVLLRSLYRLFRPRGRVRTLRIDTGMLSWAIAAGVLGALLAGGAFPTAFPDWAGFSVGASVGLVLATLCGTPRLWLAAPVRATAARSLERLARVILP
jgi:predicted anti-sigma-YlaC factor YlaD